MSSLVDSRLNLQFRYLLLWHGISFKECVIKHVAGCLHNSRELSGVLGVEAIPSDLIVVDLFLDLALFVTRPN